MAKVYAPLIRKGLKTLEDVPANLRDAVAKLLEEDTNVLAPLAACFIFAEKGGARYGYCVCNPYHQGPQDY